MGLFKKESKKEGDTLAQEAKAHIKRMHDEIVEKMDSEDKAMYDLLKIQGDLENMMQFGYHIGKKQIFNDIVTVANK